MTVDSIQTRLSSTSHQINNSFFGIVTSSLNTTTSRSSPTAAAITSVDDCLRHRKWAIFLVSSIAVFSGGLLLILALRLTQCGRRKWVKTTASWQPHPVKPPTAVPCATQLRWLAERWISGKTLVGRIIVSLSFCVSVASLMIYLIEASRPGHRGETCRPWRENTAQIVDFAFNVVFLVLFLIRFIAASDKLSFWLELHSFIDYFTVPPAFVGIYMDRQWLGLRFMRALRLISFPDIMQYLSLLRSSNNIRLAQLSCIFISVWLAASGFIHLVEITGDPFSNFENGQPLTYWDCVYFVIVTMSTVGYGDINCKTTIGRIFMTVFILGALAMFAGFIPEITDILGRRPKYSSAYDKPVGIKHIVLCGHITYDVVHNFLRDFLHEDRENHNTKCLFLNRNNPDLEMEALFKRHFTQVLFLKGSVMKTRDLERAKVNEADACLIIADARCSNPDAEDASNIMRVIAVKNFRQDIRVIVQLMRYQNKAFCVNLPSWTENDQVICLAEMKLGFMAQGCLAPGFSTLMANLFAMRSYKKSSKCSHWQDLYLRGAGMEIYTESFSAEFHNKTFPQAVKICFTRLKLLLVGVSVKAEGKNYNCVTLNPDNSFLITQNTKGFFICQSEDEAKRVTSYREASDDGFRDTISSECSTESPSMWHDFGSKLSMGWQNDSFQDRSPSESNKSIRKHVTFPPTDVIAMVPEAVTVDVASAEMFDSTGLFHWCPDALFEDCVLTNQKNRAVLKRMRDHIVLCTFADANSPPIGLSNFVIPLRASSFRLKELKTIVIVGNEQFLRKEWNTLRNLPQVYIKLGSPLNRADLRAVKVNKCYMCVVLTNNDGITDDMMLVDKEAILCSLNVKTMTFQTITNVWRTPSSGTSFTLSLLRGASARQSKGANQLSSGKRVPMLTEIANEDNVQFLDQDDEDYPDVPLYMTQAFACGRAFAASALDTLLSTTYFNSDALNLIRTIITGGATPDLEQILAEGAGIIKGHVMHDEKSVTRHRCRVAFLPLSEGVLAQYTKCCYEEMFTDALDKYGLLCLGLSRSIDHCLLSPTDYRVVITNPPAELMLSVRDMVYCFQPFGFGQSTYAQVPPQPEVFEQKTTSAEQSPPRGTHPIGEGDSTIPLHNDSKLAELFQKANATRL